MHPVAQSFRSVAEIYERSRPDYPDAVLAALVSELGLAPGRSVADLAAGTGKLTRRLLESGARVVAVEPLAEMRAVLARTAPAAEIRAGTAEATGLEAGSVDAVTVAQAFHWFDAAAAFAEIARVLPARGGLALVWNVRDLSDPLQARLHELLTPLRAGTPSEHEQPWRAELARSPHFGPLELRSFAWEQPMTAEVLRERVGSVSFVAALEAREREALLGAVAGLVAGLPATFPFRYRSDLYLCFRR